MVSLSLLSPQNRTWTACGSAQGTVIYGSLQTPELCVFKVYKASEHEHV